MCVAYGQVAQYMSALPECVVPYCGSAGERHRIRELLRQLPPHDNEARYCSKLSEQERRELKLFNATRKRTSLGRACIRTLPDSLASSPCQQVCAYYRRPFHHWSWLDEHSSSTRRACLMRVNCVLDKCLSYQTCSNIFSLLIWLLALLSNAPWFSCENLALYKFVHTYLFLITQASSCLDKHSSCLTSYIPLHRCQCDYTLS